MMVPAVSFESVFFTRNEISILENISFQISSASSVAILGPNGSGKTTLINLLFGYESPSSGNVSLWGETIGEVPLGPLQKRIGILQSAHQSRLTQKNLTVSEIVITGLHQTLGLYKIPTDVEIKKAEELLESIGLQDKSENLFQTLSSGEKTKVLLLRSLGSGKDLLVLDEPTENLDLKARIEFYQSLARWKKSRPQMTRILITHRIEEIPKDFETVLLLNNGKVLSMGKKSDCLNSENLSMLFDLSLEVIEENGQYFVLEKKPEGTE